jgi:hypothetical protein
MAAASTALAGGDAARAYELLAQAEPDSPDAEFKLLLKDCCERLWEETRREGLWSRAREMLERLRLDAGAGDEDPEALIERLVEVEENAQERFRL